MNITYLKDEKTLLLKITEELDHHVVEKLRRKADYEIERYIPRKVIFDFNNVSFMDSAGIGLIIGRYKLANMLGGKVQVANLTLPVRKIFEMSGIQRIIPEMKDCPKIREKKDRPQIIKEVQYE